ncbi:MAG: galactokinase [Treponema sp.]|nr:galactokinase [Treponema sp.]MCL2272702.1 galactokinase [Treponema sp.]
MNRNELRKIFDSSQSQEIFSGLYGESEADAARKRYEKLINEFSNDAPLEDMRFFCAPGRTELAGNHTDHNCGQVLAASIQLDSAAVVQKRSDNTVFFCSTGFPDVIVKLVDASGKSNLSPKPEEEGTTEALVRGIAAELTRRGNSIGGFSANAVSNVLPGSGLSSSAAVEVLMGRIFDSLYCGGKRAALEIAQIGQIAENSFFGKPCGLMDQTACATGGAVAIDFADAKNPAVKQINFDLAAAGYILCVVNTGGSHADLTADYASIPSEMKAVASFFGKNVLREIEKEAVIERAGELRKTLGDRALLRAIHFFDENKRVEEITSVLVKMNNAQTAEEKRTILMHYLDLIEESGASSWQLLQNVFSAKNPQTQGISAALALTKDFFKKQGIAGACRVHGGGFAGTIQAYLPTDALNVYTTFMETVFGENSITPLKIRQKGAIELLI